ncbi:hypothetical protein D8674_017647 [Pyrus ussuriensis x Pyrus communis]|uniref:Uncharacterized protein n=1 Tax=Pyrus ussuriensis x Pyrus communis TaxID=2448454 RepID=A0A5N5HGG4_9ROSA|nr:hypothetical protein D8674_017647 [Pyrus ussuriensis x Pyrus communis]
MWTEKMTRKKKGGQTRGGREQNGTAKTLHMCFRIQPATSPVEKNHEASQFEQLKMYISENRDLTTCGHSVHFATEEEKKQAYWTWGDDEDLLMPDNLTLDTNNEVVEELTKEAKTKAVEESNEKEEGSEKECEEEGGEEDSEKEGKEPNKGESEEETKADAKEEDREDPDGEESEKSRGNDGEDRGKAIELEETEEGLKLVHGTGDWDSPTNICVKLVKLLEEAVADRYEDVYGSNGEYDVVVSLLMGSI